MKKQMIYFFTVMIYLGDLQSDLQSDTLLVRIFPKATVNEYLDGCSISAIFRWLFYFLMSHSHNYELN